MNKIGRLIISLIFPQLAGFIGSLFTTPAINSWYASLNRPAIAPPNWVFAPVWTILFLLMGLALFFVWDKGLKKKEVKQALIMFDCQLLLNILWSYLFFGLQSPLYALVEIIFLWLFILATIMLFAKVSKLAAWLMVPYILWVSFAAVLNFNFLIINI